ncbi:MAG: hypothetical protein JXR78_03005 [Victivallales bacterium]|nr:hypothetical protein [Victivallales bacterium]
MNKILTISYDELSIEPDDCAAAVNAACHRGVSMRVSGVAVDRDALIICLEESPPHELVYVFVPLEAQNIEELRAELSARYYASFSLVSGFWLHETRWALLASAVSGGRDQAAG